MAFLLLQKKYILHKTQIFQKLLYHLWVFLQLFYYLLR